jgi:hypothetical protein
MRIPLGSERIFSKATTFQPKRLLSIPQQLFPKSQPTTAFLKATA